MEPLDTTNNWVEYIQYYPPAGWTETLEITDQNCTISITLLESTSKHDDNFVLSRLRVEETLDGALRKETEVEVLNFRAWPDADVPNT